MHDILCYNNKNSNNNNGFGDVYNTAQQKFQHTRTHRYLIASQAHTAKPNEQTTKYSTQHQVIAVNERTATTTPPTTIKKNIEPPLEKNQRKTHETEKGK